MKRDFMFTSESVSEGHPDKLCDIISDAVVDHFLEKDPHSRVITECAVSTNIVFISGRFSSKAVVDFAHVARKVIRRVGYDRQDFNDQICGVLTSLQELPADHYSEFDERLLGDEEIERIPVRNQATVFGFACDQTPALMPLPIWLAHRLAARAMALRREKILPFLTPDVKTQVGVEYRAGKPHRVHSVTIVAAQYQADEPSPRKLRDDLTEVLVRDVFKEERIALDQRTRIFINPNGPFAVGGPSVHSGLTGRKNAIDTYGEYAKHSGAALSGKDPLRIDRIGAYAARCAAKNVVAAGLARECEVQLSYTIGLARPVSIQVETFGTGVIADEAISARLERVFDFRLAGILREFDLRYLPGRSKGKFFQKLAAYGHVGRADLDLPWERVDQVDALRA